mgnify:CR=1 FL=1
MYYAGEDSLYVCQYFDSEYRGKIGNTAVIVQEKINSLSGSEHLSSDSPGRQKITDVTARQPFHPDRLVFDLEIEAEGEKEFSICIRIPGGYREILLSLWTGRLQMWRQKRAVLPG